MELPAAHQRRGHDVALGADVDAHLDALGHGHPQPAEVEPVLAVLGRLGLVPRALRRERRGLLLDGRGLLLDRLDGVGVLVVLAASEHAHPPAPARIPVDPCPPAPRELAGSSSSHLAPHDLLDPLHDELGDPVARAQPQHLARVVVDEHDLQLAAVARRRPCPAR